MTRTPTGDRPLTQEEYYMPGSVLRVRVDPSAAARLGPAGAGRRLLRQQPGVPPGPDAASRGVTPIAWFDSPAPLRSGWAWGQHHLDGGVAIAEARVGKGRLVLCGPEITFRAQPHGTFKFLFNALRKPAAVVADDHPGDALASPGSMPCLTAVRLAAPCSRRILAASSR